jgi:hypothetical protein
MSVNLSKRFFKGILVMKKIGLAISLVVLSALLCSCENLVTDLPTTDIDQFVDKPSVGTVTFPKGTKAIDIYNTVVSLYPDNEWHDVTKGSWKYVKSTTIIMTSDGPTTTEAYGSVSFSRIRYTHTSADPEINIHTIYLDSTYPTDYPFPHDTNIKEIIFKWQRQTTNIWQNDVVEGELSFSIY